MIRDILHNNCGDENISKLIWVCIVFVVGAILLAIIYTAFNGVVKDWYNNTMHKWFNDANGGFSVETSVSTASGVQNSGTGFFGENG